MISFRFHVKQLALFVLCPLFSCAQLSSVWLKSSQMKDPAQTDSTVILWNTQQGQYHSLSKEAKDWFYWINYARKNPKKFWDSVVVEAIQFYPELDGKYAASLKKELLSLKSLPLLSLNSDLLYTAQSHATDIAHNNKVPSHNSSNGTEFSTRLRLAGIKYCAAENICTGNHTVLLSLILLFLDINLPELGHRKNLLNQSFFEMGIGVAQMQDGSLFSVQDFSCRQGK